MKLSELFPRRAKIEIQGKEYELRFNTRAILQLERDYPDKKVAADGEEREISSALQVAEIVGAALHGKMKTSDMVNLLYAELLHTKVFPSKETLIDAIEPKDFSRYVDGIVYAHITAQLAREQVEKLEVLAEANGAKKNEANEILPGNGLSTGLNAN